MQVKQIPLNLITLPAEQHRITIDPVYIKSLAANIADVGLLNPVTVELEGDHYVLRAGRRRYEAHLLLQRDSIWANVRSPGELAHGEILTWAENLEREGLSPIEEARACQRAHTKGGLSPAQIAKRIHRSPDWVEERLALLSIPQALQDLVHSKELPMRHANELARVTDDAHRDHLTRYALLSGASFTVIRDWVGQWRLHAENPAYAPLDLPPLPADGERAVILIPCMTCGDPKPPHMLRVKHICTDCEQIVLECTAEWRQATAPAAPSLSAQDAPE